MTETKEYRVTIDGPKNAQEQWLHYLRKMADDAKVNHGISVTVEEVETEEKDWGGFE